jgi:predicted AAA+ superfamily ATPase
MNYINRHITKRIKDALKVSPVVYLNGARQTGKSTLARTIAPQIGKNNQPAEALKVFDDVIIIANRLPPGQLAVIAAVLSAGGDAKRARSAAALLDPDLLLPGEYALILPLRTAAP